MFEYALASQSTPESAALLDRVRDAGRAEARAAAQRLAAVGELLVLRCRDSGERPDWAADAWEAVAAQVGAALSCSVARAHGYLRYAMALRERLPQVGKAFAAGDIDYRAFQTIVFRTDLITDPDVLAKVDARVAVLVSRRPSLTRAGLAAAVDRVVARADCDALRRAAKAVEDRYVDLVADSSGMAWMEGRLFAPVGQALDRRLDELAGSVCDADPRTQRQRRADALAALAAGAARLVCGCGADRCPMAGEPAPASNVVIHVVADQGAVEGSGSNPGILPGVEGLIPAELIADLARSARLVPVSAPNGAPEPGYRPSAKLAEFVRCRDLTCRAPGCERPAVQCDLDHTIPYADGGATHPSNLKCLCRLHHLLKTFWSWHDEQLPDGTVIWRLPDGHTYITTPGSALLFPSLCAPTGDPPTSAATTDRCAEPTAMMPLRARTRAQDRATRIAAERRHNRQTRRATQGALPPPAPPDEDEPPPF
ncbi:HNH endonuclease signature motif containing protein [Mycobacterium terramassiliense]|uniref:13E12 repeat family protein n=1 Tax=Mycobacterium terramassiliense TaxID=1841859 RepID=A0A2U3NCB6_9MYCO|nr:HNH endonuclease signature motif containing protein [Mycobacterium terramassiliense]SPM29156.1 13E12 repeat family protein [Mycobacterium terramassiliense]